MLFRLCRKLFAQLKWLFSPKPLLSEIERVWIYDTFAWALKNFGTDFFYEATTLVTPTTNYFPDKFDSLEELAECTFDRVKQLAGIKDWPCILMGQVKDDYGSLATSMSIEEWSDDAAGTFSMRQQYGRSNAVITYDPGLLQQPEHLIATFAHELAHYLDYFSKESCPGGEQRREFATDLLAVVMGFGVFLTNSAFTFRGRASGWSIQRQGYLSQIQLVYVLAIFCVLKNIPTPDVAKHLESSLVSIFRRSIREVKERKSELQRLQSIASCRKLR
jgi:hypothetical protein